MNNIHFQLAAFFQTLPKKKKKITVLEDKRQLYGVEMVNGSERRGAAELRGFTSTRPSPPISFFLSQHKAQAVCHTFSCYFSPCRHMVPVSWPTARRGAGSQQICFSAATITRNVQLQQSWGKGDGCGVFFLYASFQTSDWILRRIFIRRTFILIFWLPMYWIVMNGSASVSILGKDTCRKCN